MTARRAPVPLRGARPGNRAVLYLRQSKEREDSESIETQEYLGREYCEQRGYTVVDVQVDRITGRKWDKRPGVVETLRLIEDNRADVIVLWKWSRLSRSRLHWALADDRVHLAGGRIESVTEPIDTSTASGRFARGVMTEYAAFQSESMGEVWAETLDRRRRKGLPPSGGERYGYVRDRDADTYAPHDLEAPILAEMYQRSLAGTGMASIARWLNESGHRTRNGNEWSARTVSRVLDSGFAAGLIHTDTGHLPGAHTAIITRETWDAFRARRASTTKPPRGTLRMASGLLRCGCGSTMFASSTSKDGVGYYSCATYHRGRARCPHPMVISRSVVERYLTEWIEALPERAAELRAAAEAEAAQRVRALEDRAALERLIGQAQKRLADLTVLLVDGKISQDAYGATSARVDAELASLRARHVRAAPTPNRDLFALVPHLVEGFTDLPPASQNRVLRQLLRHIVILPAPRKGGGVWRQRFDPWPVWRTYD
ncbi:recombinase family protein [Microbacterium stercoris]|uniref:Recombinase family protein n=1 Tax=Microbacterium stercoris TaxID=2820289 RepID=A0A939QIW6_9MICO|nr:recombinase family protein [Microbacterium stercoris]MBO3663693.1 recombinase family protein [Microbacterium stercoris]